MLLRNAWRRLDQLKMKKLQQDNKSLLMDRPHLQARRLEKDEAHPNYRPVKANVQVKVLESDLPKIRELVIRVAQEILPQETAEKIRVLSSSRTINGRRDQTRAMVVLPDLSPDQFKHIRESMRMHHILLMVAQNKRFKNGGEQEVHVPAVRMFTDSHLALLGKVDENNKPPPGSCSDGFKLLNDKIYGEVTWNGGVGGAVRRVKWLFSLGRNSTDEPWQPMTKRQLQTANYTIKNELQFKFEHGNIMEHLGIVSAKIVAGFQELAGALRLNAVCDKENIAEDDVNRKFFQTPEEYEETRKEHVSIQLGSETGELARQFDWALRESLHISRTDRNAALPLTEYLDEYGWAEQRIDNEDLLVMYGICKNFDALVEALLEADSVMYNGDDLNLLREPCMLHAHAWTAQDLASTFSPAGQGPSWYRLGHNPALL